MRSTCACVAAALLALPGCSVVEDGLPGSTTGLPPSTSDGIEIRVSTLDPIVIRTSVDGDAQGFMAGSVRLAVDGADATSGLVTLNGVELPQDPRDLRFWRVAPAGIPPVGAGGRLTLVASVGARTAQHVFTCPTALGVQASPNPIVRGAPVTLAWVGQADQNPSGSIAPAPSVWFCEHHSAASGLPNSCAARTPLPAPATRLTVTAPALSGDLGFLVQVELPGRLTQAVFPGQVVHQGICVLQQRVPFPATGP